MPVVALPVLLSPVIAFVASAAGAPPEWEAMARPAIVTPAAPAPVPAPSDAVVLFDGTSLDGWRRAGGADAPAGWRIEDGALVCVPGSGSVVTTRTFGDVQLHVEFMLPTPKPGESGQGRGNSGVYLQARYEVQVLDSFENDTYPVGQCGAIYGIAPPLVNASLPPGTWQSYDIVFRAPRFDEAGKRTAPARLTVFHNGVLVHDDQDASSPTVAAGDGSERGDGPLYLQDHGHEVRFRNIWFRPLGAEKAPPEAAGNAAPAGR